MGVNLELTPHLLSNGEIAVHAKIEISSLGASITVGGVSEPTFGQRVIEDDFRLQEGEVNLLGGLIQKTFNDQVQGIPGFGDIPGLRYLFSQDNKEVNDQEVLVMLTPRVIRLPEPGPLEGAAVPSQRVGAPRNVLVSSKTHARRFQTLSPQADRSVDSREQFRLKLFQGAGTGRQVQVVKVLV